MSLSEFKLQMEISGFPTWNSEHAEKNYKIYLEKIEKLNGKEQN